jgi:glutamate/tyrosine decarboxylase-like PLP-dependent enzyme
MEVVSKVRSAVAEIDGIELVGDPIGPVLALKSETRDLYAVAETMEDRGWYLNKLTSPRGLHLMLSPGHAAVVDQLISDLVEAVKTADGAPAPQETVRYS